MKLAPYYLLFSLAFLGIMGQKAYEYKLKQDDKKEIFCKNALFLLQAPDSLRNRVINFDLPYDSLVKELKNNVFLDSNETILFSFSTRIIHKNLKNKISKEGFNLPLYTFYISENQKKENFETSAIKNLTNHFYYINENYYSRGYDEDIYLKIDSLKYNIDTFDQFTFESEIGSPIVIIFKDNTSQEFLNKLILAYLESYLKICNDLSLKYYQKRFCELDILEVKNIDSEVKQPSFYIELNS